MSTFTEVDRERLITVSIELRDLKKGFDDMKKDLREADPPSAKEFASLQTEVRDLRDFRYYLLGAAGVISLVASLVTAMVFHFLVR